MDALEFLKEKEKICNIFIYTSMGCEGCPLRGRCNNNSAEQVEIVERWSKEKPEITMADKYIELFPHVEITANGTPMHRCPKEIKWVVDCEKNLECTKCWKQPYKKQNRTVEL